MKQFSLRDFVAESNRIEGIDTVGEYDVPTHEAFLSSLPSIESLEKFVQGVAGAPLRNKPGMDVRVGSHHPMPGGPEVRRRLRILLDSAMTPYAMHREYETLHPFMDGNGRSGRVLWLHQMGGIERVPLGFLHHWYYQSLDEGR